MDYDNFVRCRPQTDYVGNDGKKVDKFWLFPNLQDVQTFLTRNGFEISASNQQMLLSAAKYDTAKQRNKLGDGSVARWSTGDLTDDQKQWIKTTYASDLALIATIQPPPEHAGSMHEPHAGLGQQQQQQQQQHDAPTRKHEHDLTGASSSSNPPFMVQYGKARTATTLQFMTLCAANCLKYGPTTDCVFVAAKKSTPASQKCLQWVDGDPPLVCKSHKLTMPTVPTVGRGTRAVPLEFGRNKFLFATGTDPEYTAERGWQPAARALEVGSRLEAGQVKFMALTDAIGRGGDPLLLSEYAKPEVLDLSTEQVADLEAFLVPWDKLRVCCGAQMSVDYRSRLYDLHLSKEHRKIRFKYRADQPKASDMCESYDMDEIEQELVATQVYNTCGSSIELIRKLSDSDLPFDGGYCSRSLKAAITHRFAFNDKSYKRPVLW